MTVQLVSEARIGNCEHRRSAWYVGQNQWSMFWLPGRTVQTECAVAAIQAAEALDAHPPDGDPIWRAVYSGASLLGYTAREFAALLDADWRIPDPPPRLPRRRFSGWSR